MEGTRLHCQTWASFILKGDCLEDLSCLLAANANVICFLLLRALAFFRIPGAALSPRQIKKTCLPMGAVRLRRDGKVL